MALSPLCHLIGGGVNGSQNRCDDIAARDTGRFLRTIASYLERLVIAPKCIFKFRGVAWRDTKSCNSSQQCLKSEIPRDNIGMGRSRHHNYRDTFLFVSYSSGAMFCSLSPGFLEVFFQVFVSRNSKFYVQHFMHFAQITLRLETGKIMNAVHICIIDTVGHSLLVNISGSGGMIED